MKQKNKKIIFIRLIQRLIIFLFLYLLLLIVFFLMGNVQNFLDSSQLFILRIMAYTSIILLLLSLFYILISLVYSWYQKTALYLVRIPFTLFASAVAAIALFFSTGIHTLVLGTH